MESRSIRLIIEYDGTDYCGFQDQGRPDRPSIQSTLEAAWEEMTGERVRLIGSGRTDAGVHALGQVVQVSNSTTKIPLDRLPHALNVRLPRDIVVLEASEAPAGFHARYSATSKVYRYAWFNRRIRSPFWERRALWVPEPLDIGAMEEAARRLVGRHDFSAFRSAKSTVKSSVRTIFDASIRSDLPHVEFTVEGDGFLYNMVRIMAGTLLEVGLGRAAPSTVTRALRSGRREDAGATAPPHGLYLVEVRYDHASRTHEGVEAL